MTAAGPNPAQLRAIQATDHHLLVAAGAGTGKTTTVVGRILYLLEVETAGHRVAEPVSLDRIGAITYTNAAAADLKDKLRRRLREMGRRDEAYQVDNARIGTIHGFCGDILRESALRSARSPGFEVLEEGEGGALLAEAARDALVAAVAAGDVPGLAELFSRFRQAEVEQFVRQLAEEGDRLARLARAEAVGAAEGALVTLARRARALLEERLDASGAVDFDRMITWTRDLLRDDPAVRRRLQRRLHTLIVDEFQDVDPVQKEIAWLLGDPASGSAATTRLMLVGDPKQSIFRFRRADVTVWRSVEEAFERERLGEVVRLEENYRSVAPILAFVDATVGPVLDAPVNGAELQSFEVEYHAVTTSQAEGQESRAVELLLVPADPDGKLLSAEQRRPAEAAAVARRARQLHEEGVAFGDMAAVFAGMGSVELYQRALEAAGVRTYLLRGEGFYERREVLDLLLALRAVRNPRDDQALIGFLRSPFVALRDDTLLALAWNGEGVLWDRLGTAGVEEVEARARAMRLLEEHMALRDRLPIHELLQSLLEQGGYLAQLALRGEEAAQAVANVRKFLRIARRHAGASVGDFLRMVEELRAREEREGDERLHGQRDDVMTLTTVHSAKGLEWDVVFWCDLERQPPKVGGRGGDKLLIGRDALALKDPDAGKDDHQPPAWVALHDGEAEESLAERKRLWYVAATRPRRRLILAGISAGDHARGSAAEAITGRLELPGTLDGEFRYVGQGGREFLGLVHHSPLAEEPVEVQRDAWHEPLPGALPEELPPVVAPTGPARHSATSLLLRQRCARRHWLRYVAGLREPEVKRTGADYLLAVARGQVVHEVLEQLTEETEFDELLEAAIGRWGDGAPPPDTEAGTALRERLREEIALVSQQPDYQAVAGAPAARHELPFLRVTGPDAHLEGKVDLAAREGNGLVLLDVKTTQRPDDQVEEIARHYGVQRAVYVEAVEAIGALPVQRFAFQFSRAERQVSLPIGSAEREEGRRLVAEALAGIASGGAPLTDHRMECQYCGFKAAGWCPGVTERGG